MDSRMALDRWKKRGMFARKNPSIYTQIDAHANHPCHGPAT